MLILNITKDVSKIGDYLLCPENIRSIFYCQPLQGARQADATPALLLLMFQRGSQKQERMGTVHSSVPRFITETGGIQLRLGIRRAEQELTGDWPCRR